MQRIRALYFSPTGTTRTVVTALAREIAGETGKPYEELSFTTPQYRQVNPVFTKEDTVVLGVPVYAGRVPNILLTFLNSLEGNGAKAIAVVLYGNRDFDDALVELTDILMERGFDVQAAGAFIGEHSFSYTLAQGRPDQEDIQFVRSFAKDILKRDSQAKESSITVKGNCPYRPYYRPKNPQGESVDIRKVKPLTTKECTRCGRCSLLCPMGSIDKELPAKIIGICIKCGACVKCCPVEAKHFTDENYLRHKIELEQDLKDRKKPQVFFR